MSVKFPYQNKGDQGDFIETVNVVTTDDTSVTSTGTAFWFASRTKMIEFPAGTKEVWIRFDIWLKSGSSARWRVYHDVNGDGITDCYGLCKGNGSETSAWAVYNGYEMLSDKKNAYSAELYGKHSYVLHMKSGDKSSGIISYIRDGKEVYSTTTQITPDGRGIPDIYFQSDSADALFSNVIIADFPLTTDMTAGLLTEWSISIDGQTKRNVHKSVNQPFVVSRIVQSDVDTPFMIQRTVQKSLEISYPLSRITWIVVDETFYTNRKIAFNFGKIEDRIGHDGGYHLRSIMLNLAANTLSDKITCEVAAHMKPNDAMIGSLLDYSFDMMVESATYKGLAPSIDGDSYLQRVTSMYKMDALLTLPRRLRLVRYSKFAKQNNLEWVTYSETTAEAKNAANKEISSINLKYTGQTIALSIAKSLGLIPAIYFDNFKSDTAYSLKSQTTFKAMLSQNFGWTTSLPWRQINIFIRKNVLCFVQRGKEPNEINLDGYSTTIPQVTLSIYRTEWNLVDNDSTSANSANGSKGKGGFTVDWPDYDDESGDDKDKNKNDSVPLPTPEYFSGTLICGNTKLVYERGLCVSKTVLSPMDMKTVDYYSEMSYDAERRMTDKHEYSSEEGYTDTHIDYAGDSDNSSNTTTETKYDESGDVSSVVVTVSVDLGNGFVGVSTYVDGEYQGSSISGSGVITTGQYQTNESNKKLSKGKNKWMLNDEDLGTLNKTYKIPQSLYSSSLPKSDPSLLQLFADEIRAYNRSIQETISLNVVSPVVNGKIKDKHIIDFTDRILYRGNTYYLESNTVTLNMSSFTQALTFTRWRR